MPPLFCSLGGWGCQGMGIQRRAWSHKAGVEVGHLGTPASLLDPGPSFPTWTEARSLRLKGRQGPPILRLEAAGSIRGPPREVRKACPPPRRQVHPSPCVQEYAGSAKRAGAGRRVPRTPQALAGPRGRAPTTAPGARPSQPSLPFPPSPGRGRPPRELPAAPTSKGSMARAASSSSAGPPSSSGSTPIFTGGQPQSSCCTVS